jgi:hypothetical protein
MENSNFTNANLENVILENANFTNSNLTNANLTNITLDSAILTGVILTDVDLTSVDLTGVDLTSVINANVSPNSSPPNSSPPNSSPIIQSPNLSPTFKHIPHIQSAIDILEGEVEMNNFLKENKNSIAFFIYNKYYLIDKADLLKMISSNNEINRINNSIVYECLVAGTHDNPMMNQENMVLDKPLIKLASIGFPINCCYIPIQYIKKVVNNTSRIVKDRIYEVIETTDTVNSVVSYQVYHNLIDDWHGASHCQKGQGGKIYKLRKIKNAGKIISDTIKRGTIRRRKGGKSVKKSRQSRQKK